jgi:MoaA/NifB/PqqE/SkfB family radical SAM enzyme
MPVCHFTFRIGQSTLSDMTGLIATLYLGKHFLLKQGSTQGMELPAERFAALASALTDGEPVPDWLLAPAHALWGLDLADRPVAGTMLVRPDTPYGYSRASYELNLGCNYDCEHCYLGLKRFAGLDWHDRVRLLHIMRDAGVVWLQLTGGEPLVDRLFVETYRYAHDLGMFLTISTNGSRLGCKEILDLLVTRPVYKITISVYGATADGYDAVTRRPGSYRKFIKGVAAAIDAQLPMNLNLVVTRSNSHELDAMKAMAAHWGMPYHVYSNISPTIHGGAEVLRSQDPSYLRRRTPFTGCNAGHTFFHADPFGKASICKVGRDPNIPLLEEGVDGLRRLGGIADSLLGRQGGCTGCTLQGTCGTCMPLVTLYRTAKADLRTYCQHGN